MRILLIFLDGIGLGADDVATNPFAAAHTPTLIQLANGHRWLGATGRQVSDRAIFTPTDATLGVAGRPQSGTGQAAILTGRNLPQLVGRHYGPKPDAETRAILAQDNFFKQVIAHGQRAALINAYPPGLLADIARGKTLRSSIQQAAHEAGVPMLGADKLYSGEALSEDWTGEGWRVHLGYEDAPLYSPIEAGQLLVKLARQYDFTFCSHWLTDTVGHRGTMQEAIALIETFDGVMQGVLQAWDDEDGLIIITSDHGNFEVIGDRRHSLNLVPTVAIGAKRQAFSQHVQALTDIAPQMARVLF